MEDVFNHFEYLIHGVDLNFIQIPPSDKTAVLLDELKKNDFISNDTRLAHFRVLFGIPLHNTNTPFENIKWRKNKQLLFYFLRCMFPKETEMTLSRLCFLFFANKHGEKGFLPIFNKKRLEQSSDYEPLCEILKRFNE